MVLLALLSGCGNAHEPVVEETSPAPPAPAPPPPAPEAPTAPAEPPSEHPEAPEPAPPAGPSSVRGSWVHLFDDTLKSRTSIAGVVDELVRADANAVFVQVARRHDAYWFSDVLPRTTDPQMSRDLDLLDAITSEALIRGLPVHAWISISPTTHAVYDDFDPPAGWLAAEHGRDAPEADRWVTRDVDGNWSDQLDPALPEVRVHVEAIVTELVTRYTLDGIHLDYARYPSERHGYHPRVLDRYRAETGATGTPAPDDPQWSDWRREQTHELVRGVRRALDASGRPVQLTAAVVAWGPGPSGTSAGDFTGTRTYREALQDWPSWVRDGTVDAVMPMLYFRARVEDQARWFGEWTDAVSALSADHDVAIVPGVAGWLNTPVDTLDQVAAVMAVADGALVYSYQQPTDDGSRALWSQLADSSWMEPVAR